MNELLDQLALRLRHTAAVSILETLPGPAERMSLLADIIAPRPRLERASLAAAAVELQHREAREARTR